jgi:site-specific recombinase
MILSSEQQQMFNTILDLVYCLRREKDKEKASHIQYLIEAEKNKLMKSMPSFRDYIKFMANSAPLFH